MSSSKAVLAVAALLGSSITACDGFVASAGLPTAARPAAVSLRSPLTHLKCSGLEAEKDGQVASLARRDALGLAAGALLSLSSQPAWAYDFRTVPDGACSYAVPSQWEVRVSLPPAPQRSLSLSLSLSHTHTRKIYRTTPPKKLSMPPTLSRTITIRPDRLPDISRCVQLAAGGQGAH